MASINSFVNIANQMLQINSSVTQTNNIVIKFEKNINKTRNSLTALGNTRAIEKLNSSLETTNRAIQKLGINSSKMNKDNGNRLTNINILLGWAKNLINFADSTGNEYLKYNNKQLFNTCGHSFQQRHFVHSG